MDNGVGNCLQHTHPYAPSVGTAPLCKHAAGIVVIDDTPVQGKRLNSLITERRVP